MSLESLNRFREAVSRDVDLQGKLGKARDAKELAAIAVQLGAERGFEFTSAEFESSLRQPATGELSDEQLGHVAGGFFGLWWLNRSPTSTTTAKIDGESHDIKHGGSIE